MGWGSSRSWNKRGRTPEVEPDHPAELGAGRDVRDIQKSKAGSAELSVLGIWSPDKEGGRERKEREKERSSMSPVLGPCCLVCVYVWYDVWCVGPN